MKTARLNLIIGSYGTSSFSMSTVFKLELIIHSKQFNVIKLMGKSGKYSINAMLALYFAFYDKVQNEKNRKE